MTEHGTELKAVKIHPVATVGKRSVSVSGFHVDLVKQHLEEHLLKNPRQKWCPTGCLARTMFGRDTEDNRRRIRERMGKAFRSLLERHGVFMTIEYDAPGKTGRGRIVAVKLYEASEGAERQIATSQLERMHRRRQVTEELFRRANDILAGTAAS